MSVQSPANTIPYPEDLTDRDEYPGTVRWFSPSVLVTTGRKAIVSGLFGQYADSRLIHASLDPVDVCAIKTRCDFVEKLPAGADGAVWIDYVVDIGDGFDSTYAIAYLLAQKTLTVEGASEPSPRPGANHGWRPGLSGGYAQQVQKALGDPLQVRVSRQRCA